MNEQDFSGWDLRIRRPNSRLRERHAPAWPRGSRMASKLYLIAPILLSPLMFLSGLRPLVVLGSSMSPELHSGQIVMLDRHYYRQHPLERGQVVAFRWQERTYVKRVYALPGDTVRLLCNQGYCSPIRPDAVAALRRVVAKHPILSIRETRVPLDHFFCLGDYPSASVDSRELGPIPVDAILGRVRDHRG